ncbi:MAG: type IV secretion system protein [Alphaproteobacteria bacterium]|nr:type IV secretion system protein [Alphaproteobacteria bacterium]
MLGILFVLGWIFWHFFQVEIRDMVRWIRYGEMWVSSFFLPPDYEFTVNGRTLSFFDYFEGFNYDRPTKNGVVLTHYPGAAEFHKTALGYNHLAQFSAMAMQPLRWPFIALLGACALWCIFSGPGTQYRRTLGLEGLIKTQSKVFPTITPFVDFNPSTQPPRPPGSPVPAELPVFAEALGPEEWLAYNNIQIPDGQINREDAARAFIEQLGSPWRGSKNLEPYKQILLAVFCLKATRKRAEAEDLLGRLAKCWSFKHGLKLSKDRGLVSDARKVLRDKSIAGKTLSQANRHAYETTALLRTLQYAREEGGVLPSSQFVWLRAHDRQLWYPLNNLGRQSYHMEALGAIAHFKAEKLTSRPIPVPKIDHAINTIQEYMGSLYARPIPQLDYSKSKKRGVKKAV